jgi:uncharacterized low-complexity protein
MGHARYIGRIGALAVTLGIGAGLAATPSAASASGERSRQRTKSEHLEGRCGEGAERHRDRDVRRRFIGES